MTIPVPHIDAPLIVTWLLAFFILLALGVAVRPELRDGKKLSRMVSYAIGLGVFIAALLALETYRGIACNCWAVQVPQLWIDAFAILTACTLATVLHRVLFGEPRRGNPHVALQNYQQEVQRLTNGIINADDQG